MLTSPPLRSFARISFLFTGALCAAMAQKPVTIQNNDPLIYFHGRWDASPGTWWAGSGFKLNRPDTHTTVVRVNVEGWQNNRINLEIPYIPSKLAFQFVGDSLSAGQFLPKGVDQAWPFLVGEAFKAEHVVVAQPGAALSDIVSFGNEHGVSFQFFRTEDTGYFYTTDHNFTTPWNFARDEPAATHVVIHIGANDSAQNVTDVQFVQVYTEFIARLRTIYRHQPIFVFTPWGWPNPDGTVSQYFEGQYQKIVDLRHASGDKNVFLVDTTGWVSYADVFPENVHPNIPGHQHIADKFQAWLENWGLKPESRWATPA
ncbi:SGNH hydrolase-type esterase domain-containing protein [Mycena olivaceomarginata]|nr:SGNH hydrolase-type esterase domain-containing protein [Mycena olivaceomarginata]